MKDQPFGEKTLKMETGEIIKIPTVIRSLIPSAIISQYKDICREDDIKPLGESTLFKILDECSAVVRKCVEGLDNFVMEGCKGFEELEKFLLEIHGEHSQVLQTSLQKAKSYLKTGYKVHVSGKSCVADHCLSYALSSSEPYFSRNCDHEHSLVCPDCRNLESSLHEIKLSAQNHTCVNKEATMYIVEESIHAIQKWKSHLLRSKNQEQAKIDLIKNMTEDDAVITCDWAMKFLPRKYREGISQDAPVTTEILTDVAVDLLNLKTCRKLHFFSDNAGCYKSAINILNLHHQLKGKVVSYHFCEAQNGKGPCDRRASHIKSMIRRYVNQGNNVTTATQMKEAVQNEGRCKSDLKIKVVNAVNLIGEIQPKSTIPMISKLYNFVYEVKGLRMWKAYEIGEGKLIPWRSLTFPKQIIELQTIENWSSGVVRPVELQNDKENSDKSSFFNCPIENCSKMFSSQKSVDDHILLGNCAFDGREHMNVAERAKYVYAHKILSLYPSSKSQTSQEINTTEHVLTNYLQTGWALKEVKARTTFSVKQRDFMYSKFQVGKATGNKVDPFQAAEEMRLSGNFKRDEYLSGQQISSYFSRLAQQDKKISTEDHVAAQHEENQQNLKMKIETVIACFENDV